jgi:peptide chain release factor 2
MFSHEMDPNNAYLDIQAGSGGTEAQDWANILLRMYLRWADKRGFDATIMELSAGEVAGIKGATVHIKGEYAFGWLRTEIGVHRLVRKSPFDSGNRRHTSFSAVFVSPEIDDKVEIEINPADLRIDTYRSSGAGGQHVNTTDSAVRITHVPTNTVVSCQNERSQHANKDTAMKMLRAKLYEQEMQKRNAASQALEDTKSDIGWGHQIRSYVLDASRIKDLRTNIERSDCDKVLDGDIDEYLEASLKSGAVNRQPAAIPRIGRGNEPDGKSKDMSDQQLDPQALQQEENSLIALRKEKLAAERAKGNAFPNDFRRENYCKTCRNSTRTRPRKSWKRLRSRSRLPVASCSTVARSW